MRSLKAVLLVLLVLLASAAIVSAQDSDSYLIVSLEDGVPVTGEFESSASAQLFAFNGTEGDLVTITMVQTDENSTLDPYVALLGAVGEVFAFNDDSDSDKDPAFSSAIVDFELPVSGTYFVVATTFSGAYSVDADDSAGGPYGYEVTVSGFNVPDDMEAGSFSYSGGGVEIGGSADLYTTPEEQIYYVDFAGEAGQVIDLRTSLVSGNDAATDTVLWLFAPNGVRIAANDDSDGTAAEILGIELPEDGKYFIFATGFGFLTMPAEDYSQNGTFTLSLEAAGPAGK